MSRRYFGTDGIRGLVGSGVITPDFVLKLGWAVGRVLARGQGRGLVLIGKDTRISGYMFESALEAGLVAAGVDVRLLGPMPTPAIAYLTRTLHADAGIVISASHNPYHDNGIKFFSGEGSKLPDALELAIEAELEKPLQTVGSSEIGKVRRIVDAAGRYIEFCKSTVPSGFSLSGMNLVVDCAHGAAYQVAPAVFSELGATVHAMGVAPDGLNINDRVGSTAPEALVAEVLARQADLGIGLDGDGDRVILVDRHGRVVDGDQLLYVIARGALASGQGCPGVVGTQMTNLAVEHALRALGVGFVRAKVGDRYVKALMQEHDWPLGGESSGHIICSDVTTTGDGIIAALKVLHALSVLGETLDEALQSLTLYPQLMINVRTDASVALDHPVIVAKQADIERQLADKGRVLLRASGTEPLIRVMVEGEDDTLVQALASELADAVRAAMR
ncbi:MAG TPA: phosphoglucosamine mutase [Pseudomonadales bacterium]|jgi:phosphoglucosamine mutase